MGAGERAWEGPGIVPCTHNKRESQTSGDHLPEVLKLGVGLEAAGGTFLEILE